MILSGGTAGCVLAGRLAENPDLSILLVEAGPSNEAVPASAMPAGFVFPYFVHEDDRSVNFCKLGSDRRLGSGLEYRRRSFSSIKQSTARIAQRKVLYHIVPEYGNGKQ